MSVRRADLDACLGPLRAGCADPVAGVFGPDSPIWRVAREQVVLVGGGRASLLQLAHPLVGEAVARSEDAIRDPMGRFRRTFEAVYAMVFGHLDDVMAYAERVHRVHATIPGADQRHALRWVLATLVDGSLQALERVGVVLEPDELEAYWHDVVRMGALFGLRPSDLPPDHIAFRRYVDAMLASDRLRVTPNAARIGRRLLEAPDRITEPMWRTYRAMTAALLPPRFHAPFGLQYGLRERVLARAGLAAVRVAHRATPARLRYVPAFHEARRRLRQGGRPVDRLGRAVEGGVLQVLLRPA